MPSDISGGGEGHRPDLDEIRSDVYSLREDVGHLTTALSSVLGFEHIGNALSDIAEQLEPLRQLGPSQSVSSEAISQVAAIEAALRKPDWAQVERELEAAKSRAPAGRPALADLPEGGAMR